MIDSGLEGYAAWCSRGVLLVLRHVWSGRLVSQAIIDADTWGDLDRRQREEVCMSFFKRPASSMTSGKDSGSRVDDKDVVKEAPTLLAYLQEDAWPDGESRQRSSLIIFVEDGMFKGCLSDRDTDSTLWASSRSFWDLLGALEGRLTEDVPEWRRSRKKGKKG